MVLDKLPEKLQAAVREYLRERESGALKGHWEVSIWIAQLLRGGWQSGGASMMSATKEALGLDRDGALVIDTLYRGAVRAAEEGVLDGWMEKIRNAEEELSEQVAAASSGGRTVYWACVDSKGIQEDDSDGVGLTDAVSASGVLVGAERLVVTGHVVRRIQGALCAPGADFAAAAARRLGVPVVLALGNFALDFDDDAEDAEAIVLPRAHPGKMGSIAKRNEEMVLRTRCWLPLSEIDVVVTDNGGFSPSYLTS